jgi:hypothetical protein
MTMTSYLRVIAKPDVAIKGTYELVPGCAGIHSPYIAEDGTLSFEWEGETEMYWDGSDSQKNDKGETVYLGDDGQEYGESELEIVNEDGSVTAIPRVVPVPTEGEPFKPSVGALAQCIRAMLIEIDGMRLDPLHPLMIHSQPARDLLA